MLEKNQKKEHLNEGLPLWLQHNTASQYKEFLELFLSFEEREAVAGRYLIVRELVQANKTQREMTHDVEVSIAKLTRGSDSLKKISDKLRNFLLKHLTSVSSLSPTTSGIS